MYAMTIVYGRGLDPERFGRITGRTGRVYIPLNGSEIADMLGVLERAAARPATCDSVMNDSRIWAVTLVDTTKSGSYKVRSTTSVPFGVLRCAALAQMAGLDHKASLFLRISPAFRHAARAAAGHGHAGHVAVAHRDGADAHA
jgi:hypothetical protein